MNEDEALREFVGKIFGREQETPATQSTVSTESISGPVIPGQERAPDLNKRMTSEQRWVNRLFSAGTAREHIR